MIHDKPGSSFIHASPPPPSHVWYACYGSNLSFQRFSCYIQGGTPRESNSVYQGCTDKTLPTQNKQYTIHHRLYFAKSSSIWQNKGVAFLHPEEDNSCTTFGRIYFITREQFIQVLRQENGLAPDDPSMMIDLEETIQRGSTIFEDGWYSHVICLALEEGVPVFTFTNPNKLPPNPPGPHYIQTIRSGIRECYPSLTDEEIEEYFHRSGAD